VMQRTHGESHTGSRQRPNLLQQRELVPHEADFLSSAAGETKDDDPFDVGLLAAGGHSGERSLMRTRERIPNGDLVAVGDDVVRAELEIRKGRRISVVQQPRAILAVEGAVGRMKRTGGGK